MSPEAEARAAEYRGTLAMIERLHGAQAARAVQALAALHHAVASMRALIDPLRAAGAPFGDAADMAYGLLPRRAFPLTLVTNLGATSALGCADGRPPCPLHPVPHLRRRPCARLQALLERLNASSTGSANRVARALIVEFVPSIDVGEVTDKGSLNQRAVLKHRAETVERIHADAPPPEVALLQVRL